MTRRLVYAAGVGALLLLPSAAQAQRGRYSNTPPMTPFGPLYDPSTYRQAGYNPLVYQQLLEQKIMMAQQQAMLKQQQMLQKMQQQQQKNGKNPNSNPNPGQLGFGAQGNQQGMFGTGGPPHRSKKRHKKHTTDAATDLKKTASSKHAHTKSGKDTKPTATDTDAATTGAQTPAAAVATDKPTATAAAPAAKKP